MIVDQIKSKISWHIINVPSLLWRESVLVPLPNHHRVLESAISGWRIQDDDKDAIADTGQARSCRLRVPCFDALPAHTEQFIGIDPILDAMDLLHILIKEVALVFLRVDYFFENRVIVAVSTQKHHIFGWRNIEDIRQTMGICEDRPG